MQKNQEQALLTAFHLMTQGERDLLLAFAESRVAGRAIAKPSLRLVYASSGTSQRSSVIDGLRHIN